MDMGEQKGSRTPERRTPPEIPQTKAPAGTGRKKRKKKKKLSRFHVAVALFVAILIMSGALAFLLIVRPGVPEQGGKKPALFGVHEIVVTGETRYAHEDIIAASGIAVGQSIFSVNKVAAHDAILEKFPYIERVDVGNSSFDTVEIRVYEVEAIGAMETGAGWLVVGANNKGVELLPAGEAPSEYIAFKNAAPEEGVALTVGGKPLDDRSFDIVTSLLSSIEKYALEDVTVLDVSEKTNIKIVWKDQITVLLGTENNLDEEIGFFASVLPTLLQNNGANAKGQFDLRSHSDDDQENDRGIFTPEDILNSQPTTTAPGAGASSAAGGGTTAGAGTSPSQTQA